MPLGCTVPFIELMQCRTVVGIPHCYEAAEPVTAPALNAFDEHRVIPVIIRANVLRNVSVRSYRFPVAGSADKIRVRQHKISPRITGKITATDTARYLLLANIADVIGHVIPLSW